MEFVRRTSLRSLAHARTAWASALEKHLVGSSACTDTNPCIYSINEIGPRRAIVEYLGTESVQTCSNLYGSTINVKVKVKIK